MADLQSFYEEFHQTILLSNEDGKAKLPEKRDLLISNLKAGLKKWAEKDPDRDLPKFESFNQGSYAMHTGMKPKNDDYDIDVGIVIDVTKNEWPCPVELKKVVRDALEHSSRTISIRRPCVTVSYKGGVESPYHVDLAIYIKSRLWDDKLYIAKGKEHSADENKTWDHSDPKGLIDEINNKFEGDDRKQFKRCIRYLKRWRDQQFKSGGGPISIALTSAAYKWFSPNKSIGIYNDNQAMSSLVDHMISNFGFLDDKLEINLPVQPHSDLLDEMTDIQMENFKEKLESLKSSLDSANEQTRLKEATHFLKSEYGNEFPIFETKGATEGVKPFITTGSSA